MSKIVKINETLYTMFDLLNQSKFNGELTKPVITTQTCGRNKKVLGHCTVKEEWADTNEKLKYYEINMSAEYLNKPFEEIVCTLLHEMVHYYNLSNSIQDWDDSKPKYHNNMFKTKAEEVGLVLKHSKSIGWSNSKLSEQVKQEIEKWNIDKSIFTLFRIMEQKPKKERTNKKTYTYICEECNKEIKCNFEDLEYVCPTCGNKFKKKERKRKGQD